MNLPFDLHVSPGGYAWWYLDALSDDGRHGLTVIAFIGSVFSPYYALARRRGPADALEHCALNVALYAGRGSGSATGWTMTERGSGALERSATRLRIGPSSLEWKDGGLTIHVDEVTVPWPSRLRGEIRVQPAGLATQKYRLDEAGHHHWCPIAPCARIEVDLSRPAPQWQGPAYLDSNTGDRPLEQDFDRWHWSRASLDASRTAVLYDVTRRNGSQQSLALEFGADGLARDIAPPPAARLPSTRWRVERQTRCDAGFTPSVEQTLEDAPFYARSVLRTRMLGQDVTAVHESLSMRRWVAPAVQLMLPFRMPRRA